MRRRPPAAKDTFASTLARALERRRALLGLADLTAVRLLDGAGDAAAGIAVDRYGPGAVLNIADDGGLDADAVTAHARTVLDALAGDGVSAVYVKAFARDRSRLGGRLPAESTAAVPRVGAPLPEAIVVREYDTQFEVRLYDGLSTGLFLEHREHRRALAAMPPGRALNLFAYTCAFAVPLAARGWTVTNVDVSARYLEWGRRNLALNDLAAAPVRFLRRDAQSYLARAARHADERYELVILDPPSFGAADRRRGVAAWSAVRDYPALVRAATGVVAPGGVIFAASNSRDLAAPGVLRTVIRDALGRSPRWRALPSWPPDVTDRERVAAVCFQP